MQVALKCKIGLQHLFFTGLKASLLNVVFISPSILVHHVAASILAFYSFTTLRREVATSAHFVMDYFDYSDAASPSNQL